MDKNLEEITLGAGCFWCVEAVFQDLNGVERIESGYSNGISPKRPSYRYVCSGTSGYVEVLKVWFNPSVVSLDQLLNVFWATHDPTTLNRQGNDRGTQYRSGIYYTTETQKKIAEASRAKIENDMLYTDPVVTEILPLENYYTAETYHQEYYNQHKSSNPYCSYIITPKVTKFRSQFKELLK